MRSPSSKLYLRLALLVAFAGIVFPVVMSRSSEAQSSDRAAASPPVVTHAEETTTAHPDKNLFAVLKAGGVLMVPIACCSFIALVFTFERAIALRTGRVIPRPFVKRFMHRLHEGELSRDQALVLCEENGSPVATVLAHGVRKWGRPSVEVEQALLDGGERAVNVAAPLLACAQRNCHGLAPAGIAGDGLWHDPLVQRDRLERRDGQARAAGRRYLRGAFGHRGRTNRGHSRAGGLSVLSWAHRQAGYRDRTRWAKSWSGNLGRSNC